MKRMTAEVLYRVKGNPRRQLIGVDVSDRQNRKPREYGPIVARWLNLRDENVTVVGVKIRTD